MDVRLEVVHEKSRVPDVRLRRDTVVGRGKDCQLRIPVPDVSRRHCQFTIDGDALLIRDLGSSNGTQLGGQDIPPGRDILVTDGDMITVGPVSFVVHFDPEETDFVTGEEDGDGWPKDGDTDLTPGTPPQQPLFAPEPEQQPEQQPDAADEPQRPVETLQDTTIADHATLEEAPGDTADASVIELELDTPPENQSPDPPESPHKSRSLFGLFRRQSTPADTEDITDDDLMEETGEDPPDEVVPDFDADEDDIAPALRSEVLSETVDNIPVLQSAEEPPQDEDAPTESSHLTTAQPTAQPTNPRDEDVTQGIAEMLDEDDSEPFGFFEDDSTADAPPDDDNLADFLGQFGE